MGADIHIWYERREGDGWVSVEDPPVEQSDEWPEPMGGPLARRNYAVFAFLAGIRNYKDLVPISAPRGFPDDYEDRDLGIADAASWLSVDELVNFDYTQPAGPGLPSYREVLPGFFFLDVYALRAGGVERIVFTFSS